MHEEPLEIHFPQELIDEILSATTWRKLDLKSCSLVGRAWRPKSQALLFRSLHISEPEHATSIEDLPNYLSNSVHHLALQFIPREENDYELLLRSASKLLPRLHHLTSLTLRGLQVVNVRARRTRFSLRNGLDSFIRSLVTSPNDDDQSVTSHLNELTLDGVVFQTAYDFHRFMAQSRFQHLEELVVRDAWLVSPEYFIAFGVPANDGYGSNQDAWSCHYNSLKTMTILHSQTIYDALCDRRCPCDISGVERLQFVADRDREFKSPPPGNSLAHLRTLGSRIDFSASPMPAMPHLTHYYITVPVRDILEEDGILSEIEEPFLDLKDAAPKLQEVIVDLKLVFEGTDIEMTSFITQILQHGLDGILVNAPLPDGVRIVVIVPRQDDATIEAVRNALPLVNRTGFLQVVGAADYPY
ncbi:hypothetical protein Moror_4350 [Moniliophthora roreri MCA 2997]|uniref:F-box domain-containing protein n=2 Tax=Moniliophthora roreri TaxID=221103 RepID=V2XIF5_MONRO|nr:hypothetical protein Moror_4350 [Moniliophthora roreri MCA 2997]